MISSTECSGKLFAMTLPSCGLRELAASWAPDVPDAVDGEHDLVFARDDVGVVPRSLTSDALVIKKSLRIYDGHFRADVLEFYATQRTFRDLGLMLIAHLLADSPDATELRLTHPESNINLVKVEPPRWGDGVLSMDPATVTYRPADRPRYPWDSDWDDDAPTFRLTSEDWIGGINDEEWAARDTLIGHGQAPETAWLACLLLDIGNPDATVDEYHLESPGIGYGGVAPGSAEARFWLPGSFGWTDYWLAS